MKKIYIIILITIFGCHYNNSEKWDPFYLNIKNCCNDTLVVKFIYNSGQLYSQKISSNSVSSWKVVIAEKLIRMEDRALFRSIEIAITALDGVLSTEQADFVETQTPLSCKPSFP